MIHFNGFIEGGSAGEETNDMKFWQGSWPLTCFGTVEAIYELGWTPSIKYISLEDIRVKVVKGDKFVSIGIEKYDKIIHALEYMLHNIKAYVVDQNK